MKTLAIDTSTRQSSLALFQGNDLVASQWLDPTLPTTQAITPLLAELVDEAGWKPTELQLVIAAQGPGSFTGLRIGVMTAKTIAYVSGATTVGVNTLRAIAHRCDDNVSRLHVVMDAQRKQFFHAAYDRDDAGNYVEVQSTQIVDDKEFLASLNAGESITGPGLKNKLSLVPEGVRVVDENEWAPTAEAVGRVGITDFLAGRFDDFWSLNPNYYRKSAAEEKLESEAS
ncbi:tRNA (adenosine(37)-N6)-threonylcarbamoyltransferase complex dimerization subunit type 1 TsaB [Bremerella sp. P1]|uniref:tRNA (adenosine(37)-N6)-threonylcarbamoyltransferase complex dimerization subunit type 1 TsaB n=1 Tax=Bremerella sp. P1 TaxID=3026424 RepID=UPI0023679834|nr:tRNA (adenosine(37)-N6)-threonylcarbamoyltransferase complex dimerization subunit type 1 TsaB [Bremerella sp. P1]WDI41355.1 tRNA (adenosine(37)-N6)-threonylcarbamoyltransferase complex dimerization subunit type 1 TsaB [Bremerella sp. P1]